MNTIKLCSPALIYLIFSLTQIIVDTSKKLYNVALVKFVMMIIFTLLLNILCERGLGVVSWIIVFVPFVLMSVITTILLFIFGLDPSSGNIIKANYNSSLRRDNDNMEKQDPRPHRNPATHVSVKHSKHHEPQPHESRPHHSKHHQPVHMNQEKVKHSKHHDSRPHHSNHHQPVHMNQEKVKHSKHHEPQPHESRPQHSKHHSKNHRLLHTNQEKNTMMR